MGDPSSDDLPRTLRREREARERAQGRPTLSAGMPSSAPTPMHQDWSLGSAAQPAVVTAFDVPFLRLMMFAFKLALAALPAIIVLGVVLWGIGHLLMTYFPWLVKVQILIRVPN